MSAIQINGHIVSPESQSEGGSHFSRDASKSNYIIVHCVDFLKENQYDDFKAVQVEVLAYIAHNTYLCRYRPSDLERIRQLPYVVYANVFHQDFVVEASLKTRTAQPSVTASTTGPPGPGEGVLPPTIEGQTQPVPGGGLPQQKESVAEAMIFPGTDSAPGSRLHDVMVTIHPIASHEDVKQKIADVTGVDRNGIYQDGHYLRMDLKPEDLNVVAAIDEVQGIEEFPEIEFFNHIARKNIGLRDPATAIAELGINNQNIYQGHGEIIIVTDTGFDRGTTDPTLMHPAFTGKIHSLYSVNRQAAPAPTDPMEIANQSNDPSGHGTHVCGSVVGDGGSSFGTIKGTAPMARLVVQSCSKGAGGVYPKDNSIVTVLQRAYLDTTINARISTNSWGTLWSGVQQAYGTLGAAVDGMVKTHDDFFVLFAAGNDGLKMPGANIQTTSAAKNVLTVGATESTQKIEILDTTTGTQILPTRSLDYKYDGTMPPGKVANIAAFSSRGPTKAITPNLGRIKPDVVAPGTAIYSPLSGAQNDKALVIWSRMGDPPVDAEGHPLPLPTPKIDDFNKWGVTPDPGQKFPLLGGYAFINGTSHATPLVAGCAAIIRQAYMSLKTDPPSAAMMKALIVNGAIDLNNATGAARQDRGPPVTAAPDNVQGFGLVSLPASIKTITGGTCLDRQGPLTQGQSLDYTVTWDEPPNDPGSTSTPKAKLPVIVNATLVWTDPSGDPLVNQLSLKATGAFTNEVRYGNTSTTRMDLANNVQKIRWTGVPGDRLALAVRAERITSTVVGNLNQDFALVYNTELGDPAGPESFLYRLWNRYLPSMEALNKMFFLTTAGLGP